MNEWKEYVNEQKDQTKKEADELIGKFEEIRIALAQCALAARNLNRRIDEMIEDLN